MTHQRPRREFQLLGEQDYHLFNEGNHTRLYEKLGAHLCQVDGVAGAHFAVWAPNATVHVVGDFNAWTPGAAVMQPHGSGIHQLFVPEVEHGAAYKFHVVPSNGVRAEDKADPLGAFGEMPPRTASRVWDLAYTWGDAQWMSTRGPRSTLSAPMSIYELHLGSWSRTFDEHDARGRSLTYREMATGLADYVAAHGFTHVELMPLLEHPFYGSWGYQVTGYFAPTARYGTPQDLMMLIDALHQREIGVILDWPPAHFPTDGHGLRVFDGTCLYEHEDPRKGHHPDWTTAIFNYGRHEVRSFLLSSARCWLDRYHIDGLRVDGVASMLYLDYSRKEGEWIPNQYGGRENLDAIGFLRRLNESVFGDFPDVQTIAEESTAWPMVSRPTYVGGLGFGLKWDMGFMHDTLEYFQRDPVHRKYHHNKLTFRSLYAYQENFVLPLSHDEVVHGKGSLFNKMPGDDWQKFANLRLLYTYMYALPGKKLLFMGGEFGQRAEWNHDVALQWELADHPPHRGLQILIGSLNHIYRSEPGLHVGDCDSRGFEWIDADDSQQSVLTFLRKHPDYRVDQDEARTVVCAFNFTPVPRVDYQLGVPRGGVWMELLNSDAHDFGGTGMGNLGEVHATDEPSHGRPCSVRLTLPPLAAVLLRSQNHR